MSRGPQTGQDNQVAIEHIQYTVYVVQCTLPCTDHGSESKHLAPVGIQGTGAKSTNVSVHWAATQFHLLVHTWAWNTVSCIVTGACLHIHTNMYST